MVDLAIETRALCKRFGDQVAVADLSLSIPRGEIFGFLGPNGAGKTTSVKMLLGLTSVSGGDGALLGSPIGDRQTRARIGFLPEHFRFHGCLTGRELLRLHGRLYGVSRTGLEDRIETLLFRMDLSDAGDRRVEGYSKGMLQRIGLAQALLNAPALVFLDEPTSGLDPIGRLLVRDLLWELRDAGTAVFLNSHLLGEVEATCDRVVFVKHGHKVSELRLGQGSGEILLELRLGRSDSRVLDGIAQFSGRISQRDGYVQVHVDGDAVAPRIVRWLVEHDVAVYEMRVARRSLEQVFLEVRGDDLRPG
jgi:ABC-2 type transport system ATP-binding protein